jgi:ER membrane protein complex subunit 7
MAAFFLIGWLYSQRLGGDGRVAVNVAASPDDSSQSGGHQSYGVIEGRIFYPHDQSAYNETVKIVLNYGEITTYNRLQDDSRFTLRNIPPGIHVIDIYGTKHEALIHHFPQIKVQFMADQMNSPQCLRYLYPGAKKEPIDCGTSAENGAPGFLEIPVVGTYEYFETRPQFSMWYMFRNPMVIMMMLSAGMMFLMPKLMEGLDPEEKAQMRQQMAMQQDPAKMLSSLFGVGETEEPKSSQSNRIGASSTPRKTAK